MSIRYLIEDKNVTVDFPDGTTQEVALEYLRNNVVPQIERGERRESILQERRELEADPVIGATSEGKELKGSEIGVIRSTFNEIPGAIREGIAQTGEGAEALLSHALAPFGSDRLERIQDSAAFRAARSIREVNRTTFPTNPEFSQGFLTGDLPRAAGSAATFLGLGYVGKIAGLGMKPVAALGALQQGAEGFNSAVARGATGNQKFVSLLLNAGVGLSEAVPLGRILNRINTGSGGVFNHMLRGGVEEFLQETGQQFFSNVIAKLTGDERRELSDHVARGGAAGLIIGALLGAAGGFSAKQIEDKQQKTKKFVESLPENEQTELLNNLPEAERKELVELLAEEETVEPSPIPEDGKQIQESVKEEAGKAIEGVEEKPAVSKPVQPEAVAAEPKAVERIAVEIVTDGGAVDKKLESGAVIPIKDMSKPGAKTTAVSKSIPKQADEILTTVGEVKIEELDKLLKQALSLLEMPENPTPLQEYYVNYTNSIKHKLRDRYGAENRPVAAAESGGKILREAQGIAREYGHRINRNVRFVLNRFLNSVEDRIRKEGATDEDMASFRKKIDDVGTVVGTAAGGLIGLRRPSSSDLDITQTLFNTAFNWMREAIQVIKHGQFTDDQVNRMVMEVMYGQFDASGLPADLKLLHGGEAEQTSLTSQSGFDKEMWQMTEGEFASVISAHTEHTEHERLLWAGIVERAVDRGELVPQQVLSELADYQSEFGRATSVPIKRKRKETRARAVEPEQLRAAPTKGPHVITEAEKNKVNKIAEAEGIIDFVKLERALKDFDPARGTFVNHALALARRDAGRPISQRAGGGLVTADTEKVEAAAAVQQLNPSEQTQEDETIETVNKGIEIARGILNPEEQSKVDSFLDGDINKLDKKLIKKLEKAFGVAGVNKEVADELFKGPGAAPAGFVKDLILKRRKAIARFKQVESIDPELRAQVNNEHYEPTTNADTNWMVNHLIETDGLDNMANRILANDPLLAREQQVAGAYSIVSRNNKKIGQIKSKEGETTEADQKEIAKLTRMSLDLTEKVAERGTLWGRAIQAFRMWGKITAEGMLLKYTRTIKRTRDRVKREVEGDIEQLETDANKSNKQGRKGTKKATDNPNTEPGKLKKASKNGVGGKRKKAVQKMTPAEKSKWISNTWKDYQDWIAERFIEKAKAKQKNKRQLFALERFADETAKLMGATFPKQTTKTKPLPAWQRIRELVTNMDKFRQAVETTKEQLPDDLREEYEELLDAIAEMPIKQSDIDQFVLDNVDIDRVVDVFTHQDMEADRDALAKYITADTGSFLGLSKLDEATAKALQESVIKTYNKLVKREKVARFKKVFKGVKKLQKHKRNLSKVADDLIVASKYGNLSNEQIWDIAQEKLGLPAYDLKIAAKVQSDMEAAIKKPEGFQRDFAITKVLGIIAQANGVSNIDLGVSWWYASVLSGIPTQVVNVWAGAFNNMMEAGILLSFYPRSAPLVMSRAYQGLLNGFAEGEAILKEGDITRRSGILKAPADLELITKADNRLKRLIANGKYVTRFMMAADMVNFKIAEEIRSATIAWQQAQDYRDGKGEKLTESEAATMVDDLLNISPKDMEKARKTARDELGPDAPAFQIRRRINEIQQQARDPELNDTALQFALEATFTQRPAGILGAIAGGAHTAQRAHPVLRAPLPFVNIVANVSNVQLDYTPWGFKRLLLGFSDRSGTYSQPAPTGFEYHRQRTKAALGSAGIITLYLLGRAALDDDDAILEITGMGPSNKNVVRQLLDRGWQRFSIGIKFPWMEKRAYIRYEYMPFGMGLAVVGGMLDAEKYNTVDEDRDIWTRGALGIAKVPSVVFNASFLSGLGTFLFALDKGDMNSIRFLSRTTTPLVLPNIVKQNIEAIFDPTRFQANSIGSEFMRQFPVARRLAGSKPMINELGEEIEKEGTERLFGLHRFISFEKAATPVRKFLYDNAIIIGAPGKTTRINDEQINDEQYFELAQKSGQQMKEWLEKNLTNLKRKNSDSAQKAVYKKRRKIREKVADEIRRRDR